MGNFGVSLLLFSVVAVKNKITVCYSCDTYICICLYMGVVSHIIVFDFFVILTIKSRIVSIT